MTMIVGTYKEPLTFSEFVLSEAVEPKETKYGTNAPDFDNSKITDMRNLSVSFFVCNDMLYYVQNNTHTGEIGFAKANTIPKDYAELTEITFDVKPVKTSDGLGVFNRTFYVLLQILKKHHNKQVFFNPAHSDLDKLYSMLTKNKFFNKQLNSIGYSDLIFDGDVYKTYYKGTE